MHCMLSRRSLLAGGLSALAFARVHSAQATLVRAVLLPATMKLLGDWNWYLPRWLEWLPSLGHEESVAVAAPAPDEDRERDEDRELIPA